VFLGRIRDSRVRNRGIVVCNHGLSKEVSQESFGDMAFPKQVGKLQCTV
jgi:hypothetical protein